MPTHLDAWGPRLAALSRIFGTPEPGAPAGEPPLAHGGGAEVIVFPAYAGGVAYVTAGLTGDVAGVKQPPGRLGTYELVLCTHERQDWVAPYLAELARNTLAQPYNAGDTLDFTLLADSKLRALLFAELEGDDATFSLSGARCGLLLCLGVTKSELDACHHEGAAVVLRALKDFGVFPWTDPNRRAVATSRKLQHLLPSEVAELNPEDDLDRRASQLVEALIASNSILVVNRHAHTSLVPQVADAIERCGVGPDAAQKAAAYIMRVLMDAPEVIEVFTDELRLVEMLQATRRTN